MMTEAELLAAILELAAVRGWRTYHPLPARVRKHGIETWRTQAQGPGRGFPDIVLARGGGQWIEFWELKDATGQLADEQVAWRDILQSSSCVWRLVRPSSWFNGDVERWLR